MKKLIYIITLFSLFSCSVDVSNIDNDTAQDVVKSIKYVQDPRTGLCYGVVSFSQATSAHESGLTVTWVPCDSVKNFLVK